MMNQIGEPHDDADSPDCSWQTDAVFASLETVGLWRHNSKPPYKAYM